jgi:chorismate-pyruvate lyase
MSKHHDITGYVYDPISGFRPGTDASKIKPSGLQDRFRNMHPFLRTLLVTDGTVTKFLEAYLWEPIRVETLSQAEIRLASAVPALGLKAGDAVLLRRVLLRGLRSGRVYTFAESYVRMDQLDAGIQNDLREGRLGMGELLRDRRLETYREILEFGEEKADQDLSACFEIEEGASVYFRRYRINVKGRPLILIIEKFFEPRFNLEEKK